MQYYHNHIRQGNRNEACKHLARNSIPLTTLVIIAILAYALNQCTYIYQCTCIFTAVILITARETLKSSNDSIYTIILTGVTLSIPIYYIAGFTGDIGLIATSLFSLLVSCFAASYIVGIAKESYSLPMTLLIALLLSVIIDGMLMSSYLLTQTGFSFTKILNIFNRELFYKSVYGTISVLIIGIYEQRKSKVVG